MRDYNAIQYLSPTQKKQQPVSLTAAEATALSRSPVPGSLSLSLSSSHTAAAAAAAVSSSTTGIITAAATKQPLPAPVPDRVGSNSTAAPLTAAAAAAAPPPLAIATVGSTTSTASGASPIPTFRSSSPMAQLSSGNTAIHNNNHNNHYNPTSNNKVASNKATSTAIPLHAPPSSPTPSVVSSTIVAMTPADALALRREGPEAVIGRMRHQLEASDQVVSRSKANSAKSDAVILELRSTVRQLKRQMDHQQQQKNQPHPNNSLSSPPRHIRPSGSQDGSVHSQSSQTNHTNLQQQQQQQQQQQVAAAAILELQVQLDRARAQLSTADLVRKELEDTLEAEQYTWELRVQDQEREIADLTKHVTVLQQEIDESLLTQQQQHQQREPDSTDKSSTPIKSPSSDDKVQQQPKDFDYETEWKEKLLALEQERHELQGCLDEALKELEAVDAELQQDGTTVLREENERLQKMLKAYQDQQKQEQEQQQQQQDPLPTVQSRGFTSTNVFNQITDTSMHNDSYEKVALLESLQHLYRWLLERDGISDDSVHLKPNVSCNDVLDAIRIILEHQSNSDSATTQRNSELEQQLIVLQNDASLRGESNAELCTSLKEAVALLKPLQDTVAKTDRGKALLHEQLVKAQTGEDAALAEARSLKQRLNAKDDELDHLRQEIESLELQLSHAKLETANHVISHQNNKDISNTSRSIETPEDSPMTMNNTSTGSVDDLRAKRQSERTLKNLLRDAQSRFESLMQQNQQVSEINDELQGKLRDVEDSPLRNRQLQLQETIQLHESRIQDLESESSVLRMELSKKDDELISLHNELDGARATVKELDRSEGNSMMMKHAESRLFELENELAEKGKALAAKRDTERALNKSLKDALSLIKPLQMHLEEAEQEKRVIANELSALRHNSSAMSGSRSMDSVGQSHANIEALRGLEGTVRQLEKENAQLQDALEDMSQSLNASQVNSTDKIMSSTTEKQRPASKVEDRLREEIVELKSRYDVTQERLENAFVENRSVVEALRARGSGDPAAMLEVQTLQERLRNAETELDNAKFIATSALVKIEELSMAENISFNSMDHNEVYKQKERELDHELRLVRQHQTKLQYGL